jgi:hemolysin III
VSEQTWRGQTRGEEMANSVTHGFGALMGVAGLGYLVLRALRDAAVDASTLVGIAVYIGTFIALYAASTVYHAVEKATPKQWLRHVDRSAVFVFIAGCYTPFLLGPMRGAAGYLALGFVWSIAALGVTLELWLKSRFLVASTAFYLGMGWFALLGLPVAWQMLGGYGLSWVIGGGVLYTVGVGFFWWTALPFHHAIWHLFVLAGSACHFHVVAHYLLGRVG